MLDKARSTFALEAAMCVARALSTMVPKRSVHAASSCPGIGYPTVLSGSHPQSDLRNDWLRCLI